MENKQDKRGDYIFVGLMFLGMGIGYFLNNFLVGLLIGMGIGFIARVLVFPKDK